MAFPENPTDGQEHTIQGEKYVYNVAESSWLKVSYPSYIKQWDSARSYTTPNEMVRWNGIVYIVESTIDNENKDPDLATSGAYWKRLTPKVWEMDDDPSTYYEVIKGDTWIDNNQLPGASGNNNANANAVYTRGASAWLPVRGVRVIGSSDAWGTQGSTTELFVVERKRSDEEYKAGSIDLAFITKDNAWSYGRIWNLPWGREIHYSVKAGDVYSNDTYGGLIMYVSFTHKKGRRYRAVMSCKIWYSGNGTQYVTLLLKKHSDGSTVYTAKQWLQSGQNITLYGEYIYDHTTAEESIRYDVELGTVAHSLQYGETTIYIEDIGPA